MSDEAMMRTISVPEMGVVRISKPWRPTGRLRWAAPSIAAAYMQPSCRILQQEWAEEEWTAEAQWTTRTEWRDVPIEAAP